MQIAIPMSENLRKEAAACYLGISLSTFNRLYKAGKIKGYRVSPNIVQFSKAELDQLRTPSISSN
jgi:excisionase family DNA binding protein